MNDEELDELLAGTPEPSMTGDHIDDGVLHAFVKKTLAPDRAEPIARHLTACAECRLLAEGLALPPNPELMEQGRRAISSGRWPRRVLAAAGGFAAAALVLLAISRSPPDGAMPAFAMEGPFGGIRSERSAGAPASEFDEDGTLRVVFRPASPAPEVELTTRVGLNGAAPQPAEAGAYRRTAEGAVLFEARAAELFAGTAGTHRVVFELGREDQVIWKFEVEVRYLGKVSTP